MLWGTSLPALGISLLAGILLLPLAIRLANRYDLMDRPSRHKRHKRPVPILGGAAMFVSVWVTLGLSSLLFSDLFRGLVGSLPYVFSGALIVFLVGFSDDLSPVSAWIKLSAQVAAGLVLCLGGLQIDPLTIPFVGPVSVGPFSVLITVLASVLIGFLAVFLYYNRYPARIFLGDSGSLQLGFYFAVISLLVPVKLFTAAALYLPLLILGVPLLETFVSISRRLAARKNIMGADRRHLFHYLALAGLSPRIVVIVFYVLSVIFGLFAIGMIYWNRRWLLAFLILFMVVVFVSFYIFMTNLHRFRRGNSGNHRK